MTQISERLLVQAHLDAKQPKPLTPEQEADYRAAIAAEPIAPVARLAKVVAGQLPLACRICISNLCVGNYLSTPTGWRQLQNNRHPNGAEWLRFFIL